MLAGYSHPHFQVAREMARSNGLAGSGKKTHLTWYTRTTYMIQNGLVANNHHETLPKYSSLTHKGHRMLEPTAPSVVNTQWEDHI